MTASDLLKNRNPPSSILDGCLFLVRHLLILKEVMHNLEADLRQRDEGKEYEQPLGITKAVEFVPSGGVTGTFFLLLLLCSEIGGILTKLLASLSNMFTKTTSLLPEGLFASLGVSRGVEGDLRGVKLVSIF